MTTEAVQLPLDGIEPGRDSSSVPPRPTPTMTLRGYCPECGRWPTCNETTGLILSHRYPKWDAQDRRGRCAGTKTTPTTYRWLEPL